MSDMIELTAEPRTDTGRGASRRLRREADLVPAVIYGAGKDAVSLSIAHKNLHKVCQSEVFFSQIINIRLGDEVTPAIIRDLQRHPAKDRILHADFFRVSMDQIITVEIPFHFSNEDECVGVKLQGGMVFRNMTSLEVDCLPGDLPEFIAVDLETLGLGESIHLSAISLPDGVSASLLTAEEPQDQIVVSVHERRVEAEEVPTESVEAPGAESEESGKSDESDDA